MVIKRLVVFIKHVVDGRVATEIYRVGVSRLGMNVEVVIFKRVVLVVGGLNSYYDFSTDNVGYMLSY